MTTKKRPSFVVACRGLAAEHTIEGLARRWHYFTHATWSLEEQRELETYVAQRLSILGAALIDKEARGAQR